MITRYKKVQFFAYYICYRKRSNKTCVYFAGYEKHRIDAIDYANFSYSYTVIEGAVLSNMIEKISYEIKIVPTPDGGSILKKTSKYHTRGYQQIRGEEVQACHSRAQTHFKAVEDYLLVNPHLYK